MKKFQYQIIRYMHDRATAEFVNIGIVVYQPDTDFLQGKFINKYMRISQFFNEVNGQYLLTSLRQFEKQLGVMAKTLGTLFVEYNSLSEITSLILPYDDSSLYLTEVFMGIDLEPLSALNDLYDRLINKYNHENDKSYHDDKYVWRKIYKQYFDKYEITNKLKSHTVVTDNDNIEFDKAWKNGVWNCYQTLSFDLKRNDSIKNKVYRWSGILNELENSGEELHLYFLTAEALLNRSTNKFINDTILKHNNGNSLQVTIVNESKADEFVKNLKREIEEHEKLEEHEN